MKKIFHWYYLCLLFVCLLITSCSKDEPIFSGGEFSSTYKNEENSNLVVQWSNLFLNLEQYAYGMRPNASARALAYIHLAAYETALPTFEGLESNVGRLTGLEIPKPPADFDVLLALNTCYAVTVDHFVYNVTDNRKSSIAQLENEKESELIFGMSARRKNASKDWGRNVAEAIIRYSQQDTEAEDQLLEPQPLSYQPPAGEGYWTFSAEEERGLFPYWDKVRTFVVKPENTSSVPPIVYSENPNDPYYQQMMEVYHENNEAKQQDGESLWIAEFWSDDVEGMMFSPPARHLSIAKQLIEQYDLSLADALLLNLKLGFALNDAAVATWKYKYQYMVMRPSLFIRDLIDPDFQTNLYRLINWPNPSFPGYPSGHSTFASAAAGIFIEFFGNEIDFTDRSHEGRTEFRGEPRTFQSFTELAEEDGYSRVPLGVHMRMDCTEGLRLGYEISDAVKHYTLKKDPK